jgi:hypothetical protein
MNRSLELILQVVNDDRNGSRESVSDGGELSASRRGRFHPGVESPRYPFDRILGGPQSQSGRGGEEKESQPLPGTELRSSNP